MASHNPTVGYFPVTECPIVFYSLHHPFVCLQAIPPLEFLYKGDRISLSFVEAAIHNPSVAKGGICKDLRVYPAECRGRRCTYRGKLVVGQTNILHNKPKYLSMVACVADMSPSLLPLCLCTQADVSWSVNGVPKGIVKQSLGQVPIMVKSKLCNLHGLSPKELIEHHEEAEVTFRFLICLLNRKPANVCTLILSMRDASFILLHFCSVGNGRLLYN